MLGIHNYGKEHLIEAVKFLQKNYSKFEAENLLSPGLSLRELQVIIIWKETDKTSDDIIAGNGRILTKCMEIIWL